MQPYVPRVFALFDNELYIPKSEVKCQGGRIENCDGKLVARKAGQSDRQWDDKFKGEL